MVKIGTVGRASLGGIVINGFLSALAMIPATYFFVITAWAYNSQELAGKSGAGDLLGLTGCILLPITLALTHLVIPFIPTSLYAATQKFEARSSYIMLAVGINVATFAVTLVWSVLESMIWLPIRGATLSQLIEVYANIGASLLIGFHLFTLVWYVIAGLAAGLVASALVRNRSTPSRVLP